MTKTITLELRLEDSEPILWEAAYEAAKFGAWVDYLTKRTVGLPCDWNKFEERKPEWQRKFLRAKRIVEAFGVEYEQTGEGEALTVYWPDKVLKSHLVKLGPGLPAFRHIDKSVPDPKNARPEYRRSIHEEACKQAAERVVREWKRTLLPNRAQEAEETFRHCTALLGI